MKLIPFVPKVMLTDTRRKPIMEPVTDDLGEPVLDENKKPMRHQASVTQREMFTNRMDDQLLTQGKEPRAASRFSNKLYDAIEAQPDELVEYRGGWIFEDEEADALCRVVRKAPSPSQSNPQGGYNTAILHNLEPFFDAVENVVTLTSDQHKAIVNGKSWKEVQVESKPNGAEAKAEVAQA
jgi:hypothetical protein